MASNSLQEVFGDVIYAYTRASALEDGVLIDVSDMAREAGFKFPVAVTTGVWVKCVEVPPETEGIQDEKGRLWDVLWMLKMAVHSRREKTDLIHFKLHVVKTRQDLNRTPPLVKLKALCHPGDEGEPVVTIMLPEED